MKDLRDNSIYEQSQKLALKRIAIFIVLLFINPRLSMIYLAFIAIYSFVKTENPKLRFKKVLFKNPTFRLNEAFKNGIIFINHHKNSDKWRENTFDLGPCALQALEIYKQMLQKEFDTKGLFVALDFSPLDESFRAKNKALLEEYKENYLNAYSNDENFRENYPLIFCDFLNKLYSMEFEYKSFENIARLRAFLSKSEFLNVPLFCRILGKKEGHINILFKNSKGLLSINTNQQNGEASYISILEQDSDKRAFEIICKNYINDIEDEVLGFELYIPFELKPDLYKAYKIIQNLKDI